MVALDIGNKTWDVHENWGEVVAAGKYLDVVQINYTHTAEQRLQAQLAMLQKLSGIDGYELGKAMKAPTPHAREEKADELGLYFAQQILEEVLPIHDFIFTPELLTDNPLPVITYKGIKYYGPDSLLATQTGAEMEECGQAHAEFLKTGDEKWLDHLVAALYKPRWLLAGPVMKFDANRAAKRARKFSGMDPILKRGVLLFYQMCEEWYSRHYPFLYNRPPQPEPGEPTAPKEAPDYSQIDSLANSRIIRLLAGNKRGTVEQVRQMQRQEIYFELAELEREAQQLEK